MLVNKAKMHLRGGSFFLILKDLVTYSAVFFTFFQQRRPLKPILALPAKGLKCNFSVLQQFAFGVAAIFKLDKITHSWYKKY